MSQTEELKSKSLEEMCTEFLETLSASSDDSYIVEQMAALFFSINDIALYLGHDPDEFRREILFGNSPLSSAYRKGQIRTQIMLRFKTRTFAERGFDAAEKTMYEFFSAQKEVENA